MISGLFGHLYLAISNSKSGKGHNTEPNAWFVGMAPADNPEIVVVALNEHGGFGASGAAPVAMAVEREGLGPLSDDRRKVLLERLDEVERSVISHRMPGSIAEQAYILREHIHFVRKGMDRP